MRDKHAFFKSRRDRLFPTEPDAKQNDINTQPAIIKRVLFFENNQQTIVFYRLRKAEDIFIRST